MELSMHLANLLVIPVLDSLGGKLGSLLGITAALSGL